MATTQPVRCCDCKVSFTEWRNLEQVGPKDTYLALITVNQYWVVLFVVNDLKNRDHGLDGNGLLLGALHQDVTMTDAIGLHERDECLRHFLVHQGANGLLALCKSSSSR